MFSNKKCNTIGAFRFKALAHGQGFGARRRDTSERACLVATRTTHNAILSIGTSRVGQASGNNIRAVCVHACACFLAFGRAAIESRNIIRCALRFKALSHRQCFGARRRDASERACLVATRTKICNPGPWNKSGRRGRRQQHPRNPRSCMCMLSRIWQCCNREPPHHMQFFSMHSATGNASGLGSAASQASAHVVSPHAHFNAHVCP